MHALSRTRRAAAGLRSALIALSLAALFALPTAALAARGNFTATLKAPNHAPIANNYWPITINVSKGTTKLNGSVNYQFLFGGQVVSNQKGHAFKNGVFTDRLCFPARSEGQPLKLGIVVTTSYGSKTLYWALKTKAGKVTSRCKSTM